MSSPSASSSALPPARLPARLATPHQSHYASPPLGDKPLLMDPPLPWVYGLTENTHPPSWLVREVSAVRALQPTSWAPGETPWPKAPVGENASQ